jgi:GTP-binding protein
MNKLNFSLLKYHISHMNIGKLPVDSKEVAIVGRSNCGKSSAINTISGQSKLAKVSKTPGRTQCLNYFGFDDNRFIVDLPGYGFARANQETRQVWNTLIPKFLQRKQVVGLLWLMDSRHIFTKVDKLFLEILEVSQVAIVLTKVDKLTNHEKNLAKAAVQKVLPEASVFLLSSLKKQGVEPIRGLISSWL